MVVIIRIPIPFISLDLFLNSFYLSINLVVIWFEVIYFLSNLLCFTLIILLFIFVLLFGLIVQFFNFHFIALKCFSFFRLWKDNQIMFLFQTLQFRLLFLFTLVFSFKLFLFQIDSLFIIFH